MLAGLGAAVAMKTGQISEKKENYGCGGTIVLFFEPAVLCIMTKNMNNL